MAANPKPETDEFDPQRHKVFRVSVTFSYDTFVIAANREEAEECAAAYTREDRDSAEADYFVVELKDPLGDRAGNELPWGPNQWGRGELSVNAALALLSGETPPAPPPPLPELRHHTDLEWVGLASSTDHSALLGVARVGLTVAASDGFRLHLAPVEDTREGRWDPRTGETLMVPFPNIDKVFAALPPGPPTLALDDLGAAWDALMAAAKAQRYVSIPGDGCHVAFDARYLADALAGAMSETRPTQIRLTVGGSRQPMRIDFPDLGRLAVVMPVRPTSIGQAADLAAFVTPIGDGEIG